MAGTKPTAEAQKGTADSCAQPQQAQPQTIPDCKKPNTRPSSGACIQQQHRWAAASESQRKLNGPQVCPADCPYWGLTETEIELRAGRVRAAQAPRPDSPAGRLLRTAEAEAKTKAEPVPKKPKPAKIKPKRKKPQPDETTLAGRLVLARQGVGLNQAEVCQRTGLAPSTMSKSECGHSTPTAPNLAKLAALYGVSDAWLLFGQGPGPEREPEPPKWGAEPLGLGDRLRAARIKAGLTIQDASDQTGLAPMTISGAEYQESHPRPATLTALALLYRVSLDWLMLGKEAEAPQPAEPEQPGVATSESQGVIGLQSGDNQPANLTLSMQNSVNPQEGEGPFKASVPLPALWPGCHIRLTIDLNDPYQLLPLLTAIMNISPPQTPPHTPPDHSRPVDGSDPPQGRESHQGEGARE